MKILLGSKIFKLQHFGGISLYTTELLRYFHCDPDVDIKFPLLYSENQYLKKLNFLKYKNFYNYSFPFKRQIVKFLNYQTDNLIIKSLKNQDFDIFHPSYFDDYYLKYLGKKPYVITVHDMTQEIMPEHFVFDKKNRETIEIKKKLIENASRIIAISENTRKDILKLCTVKEDKIDLIYHGLPLDCVENESEYIKEMLPEKYVLYLGQRTKYKNFFNFITGIFPILQENRDLMLVCAGGASFSKTEKSFFNNLNIQNQIVRMPMGSDEELVTYYKNAVCFVFPSLYEGFGFPVLESFQCGCPLVCSNSSSFPEVAGDGAVYFDPYSQEEMKNSISKVIYDQELRQNLIQKGYMRLNNFNWLKTAELTKETYKKVLANG